MLVEVAAETIPTVAGRKVARGDERTAHHPGMQQADGRRREVIVQGMRLEAVEDVDGRRTVLPHVPEHVVHADRALEQVHRARGSPVSQVDVSWRLVAPRRAMRRVLQVRRHSISQSHVLILHRQTQLLSSLLGQVLAEGGGLMVIDLHRPVPWHGYFLTQDPVIIAVVALPPKPRALGFHVRHPAPALLRPVTLGLVALIPDEVEEFLVAHKELGRGEGWDIDLLLHTKFVIPAVGFRAVPRASQTGLARGNRHKGIVLDAPGGRGIRVPMEAALVAQREHRLRPHRGQVRLPVDNARSLKVDSLVLNAHHDDPPE
mmetsp:Transcript_122711/g.352502  ORF Transcript_122711/g.352502 Transcript_122711/m.352502 type:complete len:317 (+) Transcript_122711:1962-2912(+)